MAINWTPHPVLDELIPSKDEMAKMDPDKVLELWQRREDAIVRESEDPYRYGYDLPVWDLVDEQLKTHGTVLTMGGNRAGKSEKMAKLVVQSLVENPNTTIWVFSETAQTSISTCQALIWKYLPPEFKKMGRTSVGYVSYSLKMGFTQSKFTLPNRSVCLFKNYAQNIETIEGGELGCPQAVKPGTFNIGFWADELCPWALAEGLSYRCLTRSDPETGIPARGLISFTAVDGWNLTVKNFLTGAKIIKDEPAELLPGDKVPVIMQPVRKSASVVFFGTHKNPFGGWPAMKKQLENADKQTILCRAYGWPVRQALTPFPMFSDKHVFKHEEIPIIKDSKNNPASWVLVVDPAGSRPWAMIMVGIDAHGVAWVVDEFPNVDEFGPWVDFGKGESGRPGDGQRSLGWGIGDYADRIRKMEDGKDFVERVIDPRMGAATYARADGSSNIIDDLADEDIAINPADGVSIEQGIQSINNLLAWNTEEPWDRGNCPRLMFSDRCQNTIACLQEWRNENSCKASSDFPDCVRYFAVGAHRYIDEDDFATTGIGGY
ncbi:hypothetical protein OAK38_06220 [Verrucomicrobia bacterium]|nr:hypothetical protein [Verrucomicrobiota bacterium]